ncbi:FadR/GntR family transcriptional regulator [Sedimentitalea nanhaiensis]|uniref:Transcriptional regulator, GntR family n=1 Tax=Sedimentitalea nanhaiensis TaxID=999627 RepID=A0A1I7BH52_9RHOB|nr:FCD domain-containing protein [Sedimentitalea nanhaiensis]SFT86467.1 transcriptional regulator, GntR family [Sedimentitalea nanhaiensis]
MNSDPDFEAKQKILSLLDTGELGGSGRLPSERALSERFCIGRRRVRDALAQLEAEGLIWRKQGAGTFAGRAVDPTGALAARIAGETNALQVMEARLCVEPELAALCATRIQPNAVAQLRALAGRMDPCLPNPENELWDSALHRLIAEQACNKPLLTCFAMLDEIRANADWVAFRARARAPGSFQQTLRQHARIIDAIAAGKAEAARAAMQAHLTTRFIALRDEATEL